MFHHRQEFIMDDQVKEFSQECRHHGMRWLLIDTGNNNSSVFNKELH